jgi:nucleoside-diphosphate-sugar epimerase
MTTVADPFGTPTSVEDVDRAFEALVSLETQILNASEKGDIEGVVLRFGFFYGPEVGSTRFMIRLLKRRMMWLPGGGRGVGSWIHVDDGAAAVVAALEDAPGGSVYNVVDDEPASMGEMAREIARTLSLPKPRNLPLWLARLAGPYAAMLSSATLRVSNERIKSELGWAPEYPTFREGVKSLVRRRRDRRDDRGDS